MAPKPDIRQLAIVHLSDVHFGSEHTFNPPTAPGGDSPREPDFPTLVDKLRDDLAIEEARCPVLVAVTGDLAQTGSYRELKQAEEFIRGLSAVPAMGVKLSLGEVYMVPGNHDVAFNSADIGERWQQWIDFHNRLRATAVDRDSPWELDAVDDRLDDLGAIIVTVNSAVHVEKGKPDQDRGRVDTRQIDVMAKRLEAIDPDRLKSAIRVALIHHHPVLIPDLVEAGRGYDAVHNSAPLLTTLRRFGFHLVLHGHKHNPHVFTEDAISAYRRGEQRPILVVAGGSVASRELPKHPRCGNCYNQIVVKWNPGADQSRIVVKTRGLTVEDDDGGDLLVFNWRWHTLRTDDRQFIGGAEVPSPQVETSREFDSKHDAGAEAERSAEYQRLRFSFPVAAFMPSLVPEQVNEVRLWIVRHPLPVGVEVGPAIERVTWSAGKRFPVVTVTAEEDPNMCAVLHYYGPMLVQAHIEFADGESADAHLYVRMPEAVGLP
jgi:predicted phosphodiesterase